MECIKVDELVTELSKAMQSAQGALQAANLQTFWSYFEDADAGAVKAKSKKLVVSYPDNGKIKNGSIDVPLASLVPHGHMSLDNIDLTIYADLDVENGSLIAKLSPDEKKGLFHKDTKKKKVPGLCEIKLSFKNESAADGVKNVTATLNKNI